MSKKEHVEVATLELKNVYLHGKISGCYQAWLEDGCYISTDKFEEIIQPMKDEIKRNYGKIEEIIQNGK